jgi:hypothetical protein
MDEPEISKKWMNGGIRRQVVEGDAASVGYLNERG